MATATVGSIVVNVLANTRKFDAGLDKSGRKSKKFAKDVKLIDRAVAGLTKTIIRYTAAGLAVVKVTQIFNEQRLAVDQLAKSADKLGINIQQLQGLRFAAEQSGVAAGTLDTAMQRLTRRLAEAAQGTGEAKAAVAELGLDAAKLSKLGAGQAMRVIADSMAMVENQADRVRLAFKLFDTEGVALVNTLRGGSAGIDEMMTRLKELGPLVDREGARRFEEFNDQLNETSKQWAALKLQMSELLLPAATMGVDILSGAIGGLNAEVEGLRDEWKMVTGAINDAITAGAKFSQMLNDRISKAFQALDPFGREFGGAMPFVNFADQLFPDRAPAVTPSPQAQAARSRRLAADATQPGALTALARRLSGVDPIVKKLDEILNLSEEEIKANRRRFGGDIKSFGRGMQRQFLLNSLKPVTNFADTLTGGPLMSANGPGGVDSPVEKKRDAKTFSKALNRPLQFGSPEAIAAERTRDRGMKVQEAILAESKKHTDLLELMSGGDDIIVGGLAG